MRRILTLLVSSGVVLSATTYQTSFSLTENPISEGGHWVGGSTAGGNLWGNVRTTPGLAFGVSEPTQFGDPTAILTGSWGANQTVQAIVSTTNPTGTCCKEVELRLRMTISANSITGYEAYCSVMPDGPYCHIARWNGPNGSYCNIEASTPSTYVHNGDVLKATVTGTSTTIVTLFINGSQVAQATDAGQNCSPGGAAGPFTSGAPGIGFYDSQDNNWNTLGVSSFSATDGQGGFTVSATPSSQTVTSGANTAYTVTVAPSGGFTGTVNLSSSGQPSGATATFSPSSITTSGTSTLTVSTSSSTPAASYPITITGTSGSTTQTAAATLVVTTSGTSSTCDLNKDGSTNVVDVQLAVNKYVSCTTGPNVSSQSFVAQVISGALGASCSSTAGAHTVVLSWTASTTAGVTYNVYRATASGGYTTPLNSSSISGTAFSDCTVTPGQTYYYVIRSVDGSGNQSANSSEVVAPIPAS